MEESKELYEFLNGSMKLITKLVDDYTNMLVHMYRAERDQANQLYESLERIKGEKP